MTKEFSIKTRVYVEDTDYGGIVYHANYLKFMERARTDRLLCAGFSLQELQQRGYLFVISKATVNYLKRGKLNEMLEITANIGHLGNSSIIFQQDIFNADDPSHVYSRGEVSVVCIDKTSHRPTRIPIELKEILS